MADVNTDKEKKGEVGTLKKLTNRVDLTPMVDLGFLLITFFMLATSLAQPQSMEISMPPKDKGKAAQPQTVKASRAMTIILGKNDKVYYYFGITQNGIAPEVHESSFDPKQGIRRVLLMRNKQVNDRIATLKAAKEQKKLSDEDYKTKLAEVMQNKEAVVVLIKPGDASTYQNLIDILDEMQITNIGRYAIMPITRYDVDLVQKIAPDALAESSQKQ